MPSKNEFDNPKLTAQYAQLYSDPENPFNVLDLSEQQLAWQWITDRVFRDVAEQYHVDNFGYVISRCIPSERQPYLSRLRFSDKVTPSQYERFKDTAVIDQRVDANGLPIDFTLENDTLLHPYVVIVKNDNGTAEYGVQELTIKESQAFELLHNSDMIDKYHGVKLPGFVPYGYLQVVAELVRQATISIVYNAFGDVLVDPRGRAKLAFIANVKRLSNNRAKIARPILPIEESTLKGRNPENTDYMTTEGRRAEIELEPEYAVIVAGWWLDGMVNELLLTPIQDTAYWGDDTPKAKPFPSRYYLECAHEYHGDSPIRIQISANELALMTRPEYAEQFAKRKTKQLLPVCRHASGDSFDYVPFTVEDGERSSDGMALDKLFSDYVTHKITEAKRIEAKRAQGATK